MYVYLVPFVLLGHDHPDSGLSDASVLLDLHGFTVFREPTPVDFRDADFFALVGPTGSGKSTVIDAMCFALYGSVPRWDKRNVVSPALAPTTARGTVRLVFDMAGHRYVVARELRRLPGGNVTVRNARLERLTDAAGLGEEGEETESLAADSAVTAEVERLLGLSFEHFITCVVLPQGDFAQFLHATAGERQKILVRLLGLDEYGRIAQAANVAATDAETRADQIMLQLADYADATEETEAALAAAGAALEALADPTASATRTIRHLVGSAAETAAARDRLAGEGARLAAVRVPDAAGHVATAVAAATRSARAADDALEQAERDDDEAQQAARAAPARASLDEAIRAWKTLDEREARLPIWSRRTPSPPPAAPSRMQPTNAPALPSKRRRQRRRGPTGTTSPPLCVPPARRRGLPGVRPAGHRPATVASGCGCHRRGAGTAWRPAGCLGSRQGMRESRRGRAGRPRRPRWGPARDRGHPPAAGGCPERD